MRINCECMSVNELSIFVYIIYILYICMCVRVSLLCAIVSHRWLIITIITIILPRWPLRSGWMLFWLSWLTTVNYAHYYTYTYIFLLISAVSCSHGDTSTNGDLCRRCESEKKNTNNSKRFDFEWFRVKFSWILGQRSHCIWNSEYRMMDGMHWHSREVAKWNCATHRHSHFVLYFFHLFLSFSRGMLPHTCTLAYTTLYSSWSWSFFERRIFECSHILFNMVAMNECDNIFIGN